MENLNFVKPEEIEKELKALAAYFDGRGVDPAFAVVLMHLQSKVIIDAIGPVNFGVVNEDCNDPNCFVHKHHNQQDIN